MAGRGHGAAAMSALLEVADLGVALPMGEEQREVVRSVSLQIDAGEALGLVGESGSGKSMTARALLALLPEGARVSGSITFAGRSLQALGAAELLGAALREMAIIHQDPRAHMNPVRRIGDFLCEALIYCRGMARAEAEQRVIALLAETGIDNRPRAHVPVSARALGRAAPAGDDRRRARDRAAPADRRRAHHRARRHHPGRGNDHAR